MENINVGIIGLGERGKSLLKDVILPLNAARVTAVCDLYVDRAENVAEMIEKYGQEKPQVYTDYREVIENPDVNTIVIISSWQSHVEIALAAMKAGKPVAMEVGGAYSVDQCWELVDTYEMTKTPFMFLENCCFGKREMMVLNMVKKGIFGEVVHCAGGYHHDLRKEIAFGRENRHYRLDNYLRRNCENYPTHDLGPIAKVLDINHGNRMLTLSSYSSKAAGMHEYIKNNKPDDEELKNAEFKQGDIVTTMIKCARGETITLTLDTTLPRYYSRGFTVRGTKGMFEEVTDSVFIDGPEDMAHDFDWRVKCSGNAEEYYQKYKHPVWEQYEKEGVTGTHDGMDYLEFKIFFECVKNEKDMPVDVYDAASWMVISALSEQSIAEGGAVKSIPDFTRGKWVADIK